MAFGNIFFVMAFLPAALLIYYIFPRRLRRLPLLAVNLIFFAWGSPAALAVLGFSILYNWFAGLQLENCLQKGHDGLRRCLTGVSVFVNAALLCVYKYGAQVIEAADLPLAAPGSILGISFFTFTAISYLADVTTGRAPAEHNLIDMANYIAFFPKVTSGPIVRWSEMCEQLKNPGCSPEKAGEGAVLFVKGLVKKVLIADNLAVGFSALQGLTAMPAGSAWLGMVFYSLELYFDFSGYSDMAVGLAKMLGFDFAANFDHPYCSGSVSEFWRRWHISLGAWFREYVYFPLGGSRRGDGHTAMNLLVVWVLTGIWHGSTLNYIVWGLYHGFFVILEHFVIRDHLDFIPKALRALFVTLIAFFGWVLFFSPSLSDAVHWYAQMFGAAGLGGWDTTTLYYLKTFLPLLVIAAAGSTPLSGRLQRRIAAVPGVGGVVTSVVCLALLVVCTAFMMNATYSSFLYFQF